MTSALVSFSLSLGIATILTPLVLRWARTRQLFDAPDARKVHIAPIPRLGGVAIVIAFFAPLTALLLVDTGMTMSLQRMGDQLVGLYVGGLLIAGIGLYDDLRGANAVQKLIVQVAVAAVMIHFGYRIDVVSNPFGGAIDLGVLSIPVTVLWFVGVMNAVNLIDGLDGLAGGIGFISISTLLVLAAVNNNPIAVLVCAALAGSLGGFLIYNFNPARIFMGDTGSLFLGFVLAGLSISTSMKGSTTVALAIPILILGLPILDTTMAIGRRIRARRPIFSADQDHIHHKLLRAGFSHRGAVLALYGLTLLLAASAIAMRLASTPVAGVTITAATLSLIVILFVLSRRRGSPRDLGAPNDPAGLAVRAEVDRFGQSLDAAPTALALGELLEAHLGSSRIAAMEIDDGCEPVFGWLRDTIPQEQLHPLVRYRIPLLERAGAPGKAPSTAYLTVHFFEMMEPDANFSIVMPWERLAPSLVRNLDRHGWAPLQRRVTLLSDAPQPHGDYVLRLTRTLTGSHVRPRSSPT